MCIEIGITPNKNKSTIFHITTINKLIILDLQQNN